MACSILSAFAATEALWKDKPLMIFLLAQQKRWYFFFANTSLLERVNVLISHSLLATETFQHHFPDLDTP